MTYRPADRSGQTYQTLNNTPTGTNDPAALTEAATLDDSFLWAGGDTTVWSGWENKLAALGGVPLTGGPVPPTGPVSTASFPIVHGQGNATITGPGSRDGFESRQPLARRRRENTMKQHDPAALTIVYKYMAVSAGAALVPVAGVDVALLAGVHVSLIKRLCDHYKVDFSAHTARNILIAVLASVIPGTLGSIVGRRVLRLLPPAAGLFGWGLMSASSAVFSYGIGMLFIHHFESGGNLLSFDTRRLHEVFPHLFAKPSPSLEPAT